MQLVERQGFKNLNDFAIRGLKYTSSQKLARLKDENNKPSIEILEDIAKMFENENLHHLITGKGSISVGLYETNAETQITAKHDAKDETISTQKKLIKMYEDKIEVLESKLSGGKSTRRKTGS